MKLKKILFNVIIFVLFFAGTFACVMYAGYANMKQQELEKQRTNVDAGNNEFLTSLVQNITTAESLGGNVSLKSTSGRTNISGIVELSNSGGIKAHATLNGYFENTDIELVAYYITDTLYLTYENMNISFNVEDTISALSSILNGVTGGSLSELISLETLQTALTDIKTTELASGGQKVEISVPYIGDLYIITNAKDVPIFMSATNVQLNNDVYSLTVNLNSESKPFTVDTSIYSHIEVNNYSEIISSIVKIITEGGATFVGNIISENLPYPIDVELTINKELEILLSLQLDNVKAQAFYSGDTIYIDLFNNILSTSVDDLMKLINHYSSTTTSNFELKVIDKSQLELNTSIGSFTIGFDIQNSNLNNIYVNGAEFTIDLQNIGTVKEINFPYEKAKNISYQSLSSTIDKCINLISANKYSIEISGKINDLQISGNCYAELNQNKTSIKNFAFCGRLSGKTLSLYYTDDYYFLSYNGTNIKVSSECVNDLIDYFSNETQVDYIDFNDVIDFIKNTAIKLQINSSSSLSLVNATSSISALLRDNVAEFSATNICIAENILSVNAKIYTNSTAFKTYLSTLDKCNFTDCSKSDDLVKIVANTAKQSSASYTGNISIQLIPFEIVNVGIDLNTYYQNGKLKLVANLTNLPRQTVLTSYNTLTYKNHKATVTIYNGKINIVRTIEERFTNTTRIETNTTYNLNQINIDTLGEIMGLSAYSLGLIKNSSSNSNFVIDSGALAKGIEKTDTSLILSTDIFKTIGLSEVQTKLYHDSKHLTELVVDCSIKNSLKMHISLTKK